MKNKAVRALLATALCVSMLGTTAAAADQDLSSTTGTTINGDSTVENPVYRLTVPTGVTFAVDPFEQKNQSQIYSQELLMINKSNVPVQVTASVKVEGAAGQDVTLVDAESKVTETDTAKKVYIAAEIPSTVTETTAAAAAYPTALVTDGQDVYESGSGKAPAGATTAVEDMVDTTAVAGTYTSSKKVTLGATDTELVFALAGATYQQYYTKDDKSTSASQFKAVAADEKGSTVFRFCGKVNTKAAWADNDLSATVKYDLIGLTGTNYAAANIATDAHAYVIATPESDGTTDIHIAFEGAKPAVGDVSIKSPVAATAAYKPGADQYPKNIEITDTEIVIKTTWLTAWSGNAAYGKGTYTVTAGGKTYNFVLK